MRSPGTKQFSKALTPQLVRRPSGGRKLTKFVLRGKTRKRSLSQTRLLPLPPRAASRKPVFSSLQWGFSVLPLLASGAADLTAVGRCPRTVGFLPASLASTHEVPIALLESSNPHSWHQISLGGRLRDFHFFFLLPLPSPPFPFPPQFSICKNQQKRESLLGESAGLESQVYTSACSATLCQVFHFFPPVHNTTNNSRDSEW